MKRRSFIQALTGLVAVVPGFSAFAKPVVITGQESRSWYQDYDVFTVDPSPEGALDGWTWTQESGYEIAPDWGRTSPAK